MAPSRACPVCHARSVRRRTARRPDVQSFRCSSCLAAWDVTTGRVSAVDQAPERRRGLPMTCHDCGSIHLVPVERSATRSLYTCGRCGASVALRVRAASLDALLEKA